MLNGPLYLLRPTDTMRQITIRNVPDRILEEALIELVSQNIIVGDAKVLEGSAAYKIKGDHESRPCIEL